MSYDPLEDYDPSEDEEEEETTPETWVWCLHCERCYQRKAARVVRGLRMCHYLDCDGDAFFDAWNWNHMREGREDRYPEVPEIGVRYPQYG